MMNGHGLLQKAPSFKTVFFKIDYDHDKEFERQSHPVRAGEWDTEDDLPDGEYGEDRTNVLQSCCAALQKVLTLYFCYELSNLFFTLSQEPELEEIADETNSAY